MSAVWILGGGLIGAGWVPAFLAAGHAVTVLDPDPDAARGRVADACAAAGVADRAVVIPTPPPGDPPVLLQECLPERVETKTRALAALVPHLGPRTVIASSSSGLSPDDLADGVPGPERLLIAHPCNPPWLMPVVELSGGGLTAPWALDAAEAVYTGMGKRVLRLGRPMPGHLVNRLQAALWREAVHLVATGAASMADVETAVREGLAPRWTIMGPNAVFHVSGGDAGMAGFLNALGPQVERWWDSLGAPRLDPPTRAALVAGMAGADPRPPAAIAAERDTRLPEILHFLNPPQGETR